MNRPVRKDSVSVSLPTGALGALNARVAAGEFSTLDQAVTAALLELEHYRAVERLGGEAAFRALVEEVQADSLSSVGETDAFAFLHALIDRYENMADEREGRA